MCGASGLAERVGARARSRAARASSRAARAWLARVVRADHVCLRHARTLLLRERETICINTHHYFLYKPILIRYVGNYNAVLV